MQQGLLYCGSSWGSTFCITKLIETICSGILLLWIFWEVIAQIRQTGTFTYRFVEVMQTLMIFTLVYNIAFALDHSLGFLYYLEFLFYDWYFCTLVFYVTYKIFTKDPRHNEQKITILKIVFSFMILAFMGIFVYSVVVNLRTCDEIWFIGIDALGLISCLVMVLIGRDHQRKEIQKILDFKNSQQIKNPLSRMWILIIVNLVCQGAQLIQSLVFLFQTEVTCGFSVNQTFNQILKVLFSMLSLHTSFICTIILFRLRRKGELTYTQNLSRSFSGDPVVQEYLQMIAYRKPTTISTRKQTSLGEKG